VKFKEVYTAVMNHREQELNKHEMFAVVRVQEQNVNAQREALKASVYSRRRYNTGRTAKFSTLESHGMKAGPWFAHIESEKILKRFDTISQLHEKLQIVKKHLKM
jgi:hypothetical protein